MIEPRHLRYYAFVWPLFWPVLWLNLRRLTAWQKQTRRVVLIRIDRCGNLTIQAMADAPNPGRYRYTPPAVPAWQRPSRWSDLPETIVDDIAHLETVHGAWAGAPQTQIAATAPFILHDTS